MCTLLPVELLQDVFRAAAAQQIDTNPRGAAALQLISRETRELVRPVLFLVLIIRVPPSDSSKTPSLEFFHHLLLNPFSAPRAYVQHIVIIAPSNASVEEPEDLAHIVPWKLDSVAFEVKHLPLLACMESLRLTPGRVFIHPPTPIRIPFFVNAHWYQYLLPPIDLELHVTWPDRQSERHRGYTQDFLGHTVKAIRTFAHKTLGSFAHQFARRSLIIELGFLADSEVPYVKHFLEDLSLGPPLTAVLVIPCPASATNGTFMSTTQRSLLTDLKAHLDETVISTRLTIALNDGTIRPQTGDEYARAVRGGWKGPINSGTISLDDALAF